jgi:dihydrofolate synthase/folylpolyglutamate synthase
MLDKLFTIKQYDVKQSTRHTDLLFNLRKKFLNQVFGNSFTTSKRAANCKIIHVAGTKGKGSTVEYISAGLIGDKKNVGIFSSPHLHTARERIKHNRELISQSDMITSGTKALSLLEGLDWAVIFDQLLATSLVYFGMKDVDYIVLETGIGGRYDSTNFVDNPAACVITSISLDHQTILGDTIEEIA